MKKWTNNGKIVTLIGALMFVLTAVFLIVNVFIINANAGVACLMAVISTLGAIVMFVLHYVL